MKPSTTQSSSKSPQTPESKKKLVLAPYSNQTFPSLPTRNKFSPIASPPTFSQLVQMPNTLVSPTPFKRSNFISSGSSNTSPNKSTSSYLVHPNLQIVKILEEEEIRLHKQSFQTLIDFIFSNDSLFIGNRPRGYYEAILIDSGSIRIEHKKNINQISKYQIDFSKFQIIKVLSLSDWRAKPYTHKALSNWPQNPSYNYYDYQDAWYNVLYLRHYSHSWFMFFDQRFDFNQGFPEWFIKWFYYLGSIVDILPTSVKEGFSKFQELYPQDITTHEYLLQFSALFKVPWIITWNFNIRPAEGLSPARLERVVRIKWWDKMPIIQVERLSRQGIVNYFSNSNSFEESSQVQTRSSTISEEEELRLLMSAPTKEEMRRLLRQIKDSQGSSSDGSVKQEDASDQKIDQDAQDPYSEYSPYD